MRWEDEQYVKLYTRDTLTWMSWGWQARTVFLHLIRKVDHAGLLECEGFDPSKAVALIVGLPEEVVSPGLAELAKSGTVEIGPGCVVIPKFVEAQEARKTDKARKRDQRQRDRDKARSQPSKILAESHAVTRGHAASHGVTQEAESGDSGHTVSRDVTRGHPPSSSPSPTPSSSPSPTPAKATAAPPPEPPPPKAPDNPLSDGHAFFAQVQLERTESGLPREKPPHPSKVGAWWSEVLMELNGRVELLPKLYRGFSKDPFWRDKQPPLPFHGFMSQWRKYVPVEPTH